MEFDREAKCGGRLEYTGDLIGRKGDPFAKAVDGIGKTFGCDHWEHLVHDPRDVARLVPSCFRRNGMSAEKGRSHADRPLAPEVPCCVQRLSLAVEVKPVARL